MLTLQDLFNNAWRHAVVERHPPAMDPRSSVCYYRVPTDDSSTPERCLIGCSIPDDLYRPEGEGKTGSVMLVLCGVAVEGLPKGLYIDVMDAIGRTITTPETMAIDGLQRCHDGATISLDATFHMTHHHRAIYGDLIRHSGEDYFMAVERNLRQFAFTHSLTIPLTGAQG